LKISRDGAWLTNPWFDSIFLIGFFALLAIMLMGYSGQGLLPISIFSILRFFSTLIAVAHFIASPLIVYLDINELRNKLLRYLWLPLAFVFLYIILRLRGFQDLSATVLFYLVALHSVFQNYFIMQAYNFTQAQYPKADLMINSFALLLAPTYFYLCTVRDTPFNYGGIVTKFSVSPYFLRGLGFLAFFSTAVFIARQVYIYLRRRKIAVFNILMVLVSNCIFYLPLIVFKDNKIFMLGIFRYLHGLQYLAWLILYSQLKFKEYQLMGAEFVAGFHLPRRGIVLFVLFVTPSYIYLTIMKTICNSVHGKDIQEIIFYSAATFHVLIDGFLWCNFRRIRNLIALSK